jgi:hypothetical protein
MITGRGKQVSDAIQRELDRRGIVEVDAVTAASWLETAGMLNDAEKRRGKPLRDLLRAGTIEGAEQRPPRPWGRWFIHQRRAAP